MDFRSSTEFLQVALSYPRPQINLLSSPDVFSGSSVKLLLVVLLFVLCPDVWDFKLRLSEWNWSWCFRVKSSDYRLKIKNQRRKRNLSRQTDRWRERRRGGALRALLLPHFKNSTGHFTLKGHDLQNKSLLWSWNNETIRALDRRQKRRQSPNLRLSGKININSFDLHFSGKNTLHFSYMHRLRDTYKWA